MSRRGRCALLAGLLLTAAPPIAIPEARADERSVIVQATTLRSGPGQSSGPVARLDAGTEVERGRRSGGWLAVETVDDGGRSGWVQVWQVRTVAAGDSGGNPILNGLRRFSRAVSGLFGSEGAREVEQGNVTATIGVRGLKPGEFTGARPDPAARGRVAETRADPAQARAFAHAAGLSRRQVGTPGAAAGEARDWGEW